MTDSDGLWCCERIEEGQEAGAAGLAGAGCGGGDGGGGPGAGAGVDRPLSGLLKLFTKNIFEELAQ